MEITERDNLINLLEKLKKGITGEHYCEKGYFSRCYTCDANDRNKIYNEGIFDAQEEIKKIGPKNKFRRKRSCKSLNHILSN